MMTSENVNVSPQGDISVKNVSARTPVIVLDASQVDRREDSLNTLIRGLQVGRVASRLKSLTLAGSPTPHVHVLTGYLSSDRKLSALEEMNLSYIPLSLEAIGHICALLNPFQGIMTLKRLILASCALGASGTISICDAMRGNTVLQDLLLSGNGCTDKAIPALVAALQNYENSIGLLGLAGNQLTEVGISLLCPVLGRSGVKIHTFQIGNNQAVGDKFLDSLFANLQATDNISSLNLSNCGMSRGQWSRFLPFISSLIVLNLSHNQIGDDEFIKVCKGLETCFSLRYLDLSYNSFGGRRCSVVQQMLESNRSIYSINLSAIFLVDEVWRSISTGLMTNPVLSSLDCSTCDLRLDTALQLCAAFQRNEVCSLVLSNNALPAALIDDPRVYCMDPANKVPLTLENARYLPLRPDAAVRSLSTSAEWRAARSREIVTSLEHLTSLRIAASAASSGSDSGGDVGQELQTSENGFLCLPTYQLLEKSDYYTSVADMDNLVEVADLVNAPGEKIISVAYGRPSLVVGSIAITSSTTFEEAKLRIEPVVRQYLVNSEPAALETLVKEFHVLDTEGAVVSGDGLRLRFVWLELCVKQLATIVIRPANWMQL